METRNLASQLQPSLSLSLYLCLFRGRSFSGYLHGDGCRLALTLSAITARFGPSVTLVAGTGLIGASLCPDAAELLSGRRLWQRSACGDSLAVQVNFTGPVPSEHEQDRTKAV
jgi:hypothetical protein